MRLKGDPHPIEPLKTVDRYAVYAHLVNAAQIFTTNDLNSLPDEIKKGRSVQLSYCIVVDLFDVANQMKERMIKAYFVDDHSKRAK